MKKSSLLVFLFASAFCLAAELAVNGDFRDLKSDGLPLKWMRNAWSGYEPACTLEVLSGEGKQGNALRMSDIKSERGAAFNTDFYPARCGDTVRITYRARGRGKGKIQMYFKTLAGEWNFISPQSAPFNVTETWREYTAILPVLNGKTGETGSFDISVEMEKDSELEISDFEVNLQESRFRGDTPFPDKWIAFGPVNESFQPSKRDFQQIPNTLAGKSGKNYIRGNRTLDMAELLPKEKQCCWLFAELDSPIDCEYSLGAGADWWMQCYVNGKLVIDTTETGNVEYPYDITNHMVDVNLQKGKNILAVKLIRGDNSAILKIGGAQELAAKVLKLKITHLKWIEDFNGKSVSCSGNPELISDFPAPGLLAPTGQGVFRTNGTLRIEPQLTSLDAPQARDDSRVIGARIQNFGENETEGKLSMVFQEGDKELRLVIENEKAQNDLHLTVQENGVVLVKQDYSKNGLPADFLFGGDALGRFAVMATSLSGGANIAFAGETAFFAEHKTLNPYLEFQAQEGILTIDNFCLATAQEKTQFSTVPYSVKPLPEFDPVKAGWKLVFDDEFDGDDIDWNKWKPAWAHCDGFHTVKDGILTIKADWTDDTHTKLGAASIKTRTKYLYGYFEWRGRFKRQSGWWSAFWLYGESNTNPFYDGFEIDIYEDYYLAAMEKGKPPRNVLDHNLHILLGSTLKSWNYNGPKLDDPDAYTTIGCKWTPFEISYYMNGKLIRSQANHSPYDSVTFDPFNHSCGITPLEVIVSSQINRKSGGPTDLGTFPDYFYTDYVRVYEYPRDDEPQIQWTATPSQNFCKLGDTLEFSLEAQPNDTTHSPVKNVYLFDSGFLIDHRSEPPYSFKVLMTKEFYDTTDYVRPGRQSIVPNFEENIHSYVAYVQDEAGNVSHTDAWTLMGIMKDDAVDSKPYQGIVPTLPGVVELVRFDEGGEEVAYHDTTPKNEFADRGGFRVNEGVDCSNASIGYIQSCEWINYTVDIAEEGEYSVDFLFGTPSTTLGKVYLMLDGFNVIGEFPIQRKPEEPMDWNCTKHTTCKVHLPQGRHILRLYFAASLNAAKLTFTKE